MKTQIVIEESFKTTVEIHNYGTGDIFMIITEFDYESDEAGIPSKTYYKIDTKAALELAAALEKAAKGDRDDKAL